MPLLPNEASIRRLVGAILMEQTEEGTVRRARYMTLETLAPVCVLREIDPPDRFLILSTLAVSLPQARSG